MPFLGDHGFENPPPPPWMPTPDTLDDGVWVKLVTKDEHYCKRPGWFQRWRKKAEAGSIWQCLVCKKKWQLGHNTEGGMHWYRLAGPRDVDVSP